MHKVNLYLCIVLNLKEPNSPYNLKDTGDLYASFTVKVNSDGDAVVEADYLKMVLI